MVRHVLGAVVTALILLLLTAAPAGAHAELESSDPVDGATLAAPPAAVTFTFGEKLLDQGNAVVVTHLDSGARLTLGAVEVDGDTVSAAWPETSAAGQYRAAYRVVSADGHPIEGTVTFTVTTGAGTTGADASGAPTAAASPGGSATPGEAGSSPQTPSEATTNGSAPGAALWGGAAVVVLALAAGVILIRRRRRQP